MTFRLFVSHSSPDQESQDRLEDLAGAITAASDGAIRVLYDKDQITGGDDWRRRIAYLLHACDGAIVLLDRPAFESPWVLAEAFFLSIRQDHDSSFRLVPVSFLDDDDLRAARMASAVEEAGEGSWQPVQLRDLQFVLEQSVEAIATRVVDAFQADGGLAPRNNLVEMLADQLRSPLEHAPENALSLLADELDDSVPYLATDVRTRAALTIARHMICQASLLLARQQINRLGTAFVKEHRDSVLESLSPLPYDVEAAALLLLRRGDDAFAHTWLQTKTPGHTAPRYVQRAHLPNDPGPIFTLVTRHASVDSIRAELREESRKRWASHPGTSELPDDRVDAILGAASMYVVLPPVDGLVLKELETAYPKMAFVMCHEADDDTVPPPGVRKVIPVLDPSREDRIVSEYYEALL